MTSYTATIISNNNSNSTNILLPSGISLSSNFLADNKSTLGAAYGYASYGIEGNTGVIETAGHNGAVTPPLLVRIGGVAAATFTAGLTTVPALAITGAVSSIGPAVTTGLTNLGGTQAGTIWDSTLNMESLSTAGFIAANYGPTTHIVGDTLETAVRPLYAIISTLLALLQQRKII